MTEYAVIIPDETLKVLETIMDIKSLFKRVEVNPNESIVYYI